MWIAENQKHAMAGMKGAQLRNIGVYRDQYRAGIADQGDDVVRTGANDPDPRGMDYSLGRINDLATSGVQSGSMTAMEGHAFTKAAEKQLIGGRSKRLTDIGQPDAATALIDQHPGLLDPYVEDSLRKGAEKAKDKLGTQSYINGVWGSGDKGYGGNPAPGAMSVGDMKAAALRAGFEEEPANIMAATAMAESGGNPHAANEVGEHSYGITQINADAHGPVAREALGNPDRAMQLAYKISEGGTNFAPWTMFKNGQYKQYLGQAQQASSSGSATAVAPSDRVDETTNPDLAAKINAAPAAGEPIPLDVGGGAPDQLTGQPQRSASQAGPGVAPLPDIDAKRGQVMDDLAAGRITQDRANVALAAISSRYNHMQATQANDRAAMTRTLQNGTAMLADGRDFDYDPAAIRHFFPQEKADEFLQQLQDARRRPGQDAGAQHEPRGHRRRARPDVGRHGRPDGDRLRQAQADARPLRHGGCRPLPAARRQERRPGALRRAKQPDGRRGTRRDRPEGSGDVRKLRDCEPL
jgi:hypothetical protein